MFKRLISAVLCIAIVISLLLAGQYDCVAKETKINGDFAWKPLYGVEVGFQTIKNAAGKNAEVTNVTGVGAATWYSPCVDIYSAIRNDIKKNGAGDYRVEFCFSPKGSGNDPVNMKVIMRASNKTVFAENPIGNEHFLLGIVAANEMTLGSWYDVSFTMGINQDDVKDAEGFWHICFDGVPKEVKSMQIYGFNVYRVGGLTENGYGNLSVKKSSTFAASGSAANNGTNANNNFGNNFGNNFSNFWETIFGNGGIGNNNNNNTNNGSSVQTGVNLLDAKTSGFEGISSVNETKWFSFSAGEMSIEPGYAGNSLKMKTPEVTWGSPALDIRPYIKSAGVYTFSMMVYFEDTAPSSTKLLIRSTKPCSLVEKSGGNYYKNFTDAKLKADKWTRLSGSFEVKESDLYIDDQWKVCFSVISEDVKSVIIDEVFLIKGKVGDLPPVSAPTNNNANENSGTDAGSSGQDTVRPDNNSVKAIEFYGTEVIDTAITVSGISFAIVAVTIAVKIKAARFKKIKEESKAK